ncbi:FprA family A-type flavoprotein [Methanofollis aquaemaris]|uniref:FprA family A-type flavoprotein n=1 Tax=Methanofollis aquaemaris TaxID=126734 RepID=A0A8A3S361_9EURY|nr:FprA family A-type flavoprotein [Methanofollis aquaemaris]QSZ66575.1 FprA family A-type flavoprotein [Methanofollis aquaemaris]
MAVREIAPGVHAVGAVDWNLRLFDALIGTPQGTSYNAFVVKGSEKTALIDTVDPKFEEEILKNLMRLGLGSLDYIVINHAEQDHSGTLPLLLEMFPSATVIADEKCRDLLVRLLLVPEDRIRIVKDGESLDLGGKTLEFMVTPWVHWPETMLTYEREDGILFSCDLFGSHLATSELYADDFMRILPAAKRYYAEIMMPFRASVRAALERVSALDLQVIAPSHGPLHRDPIPILDSYAEWTSDAVKNLVLIPYVSMHGSTAKMVSFFTDALIERGVEVQPYDLTRADLGEVAMTAVDAATIVFAAPTVLFGPHPAAVHASYLLSILRPKTKFISVIGSYGWGGKTVQHLTETLSHLDAEMIEPVYVRGYPGGEDLAALVELADTIVKKHEDVVP